MSRWAKGAGMGGFADRHAIGMASHVGKFSGRAAKIFLLVQPAVQWLGVKILTVHWLVFCGHVEDSPVLNRSCAISSAVLP